MARLWLTAAIRRHVPCSTVAVAALASIGASQSAVSRGFEKLQLSNRFYSEGAAIADLDRDGHVDVIAGPYWYRGPTFEQSREIYAPRPFDPKSYSDNFFAFAHDFDHDEWPDLLIIGFPGQQATWYRNPGVADGHWSAHLAFDGVDNESPHFVDLTGDGQPELVCQHADRLGYATADPGDPGAPWTWHPISATGIGGRFTHGLGVGDLDGDGRSDVLWKHGWWQQPESLADDPTWQHHGQKFAGRGGAQMLVYDIDGDGDADVVSSDDAHGYGLSWFEQQRTGDAIRFAQHEIMGSDPDRSRHGLAIGNLHALCAADIDADGLLDIVTGNRYLAHSGRDPADRERAALAWFELRRDQGVVRFVPHEIDEHSGVGTEVVAGDIDDDGDLDIVIGNKMGTFVHRQDVRRVSEREQRARERQRLAQRRPNARVGELPRGRDGVELNLGFESGDLRDWSVEGEAFVGMPVDGDTVVARRGDMRSGHIGRFWVGSHEARLSDDARGTLTSVPFVVSQPFVSFLVGGGRRDDARVELVRADDGRVVFTATGENHEKLRPVTADVSEHRGRELIVRIVDDANGDWGHVNFDDLRLHAERPSSRLDPDDPRGFAAADAVARMQLPPGFHVDVGAAEPDVRQPIAMAIDARGRLWVAEAFAYPKRRPEGEGHDTILVFEDRDGDGSLEQRTVFADDLNLVSGIEVGFGGVFVGAAPQLLFIPDHDDDLVPDAAPEVLLDGWGYQDTHETLNAFTWGPDGWLYGCHGVFTHSRVGAPDTPAAERTPLNAGVWRYHPTQRTFEVFAHGTSNPWGIDFDARGQAFITACVIPHAYHVVHGGRYRRQAGSHFDRYTYRDLETIADHLHYLGSSPYTGSQLSESAGGGHAHCGAMIYRGGAWPEPYAEALVMGNLHGHRLLTDRLRRSGSGFVASHGEDLLVARDPQFMAVAFDYDHAGDVWIIDWYDRQTCHTKKVERWDRGSGRIYRLRHGDRGAASPAPDLHRKSDSELVDLLGADNAWYARRARRLLQERGGSPAVTERLRTAASSSLEHLWALHVTSGIPSDLARELLASQNDDIRAWTIQLVLEGRAVDSATLESLEQLAADDPSPVVRLYLASALQRLPHAQRWTIAARLAAHAEDADDHNIPRLVWYGIAPAVPAEPERALALASSSRIAELRELIVRRLVDAEGLALAAVIDRVATAESARAMRGWLDPIRDALSGRHDVPLPTAWPRARDRALALAAPELTEAVMAIGAAFGDRELLPFLRARAGAVAEPSADRRRALELTVRYPADDAAAAWLRGLLRDPAVSDIAVRALRSHDGPATSQAILSAWAAFPPPAQRAALTTLVSRLAWTDALLDAVERGAIDATVLDASVRQRIAGHADAKLDQKLLSVWGHARPSTEPVDAEVDRYREMIEGHALAHTDLSRGRALFVRTCMACHRLFDQGTEIGPDLTGSNRTDLDYLLRNIIDPSAEVAREYMLATVELTSGELHSGMIRDETAARLRVVNAGVPAVTLNRNQIRRIERHASSLMPPGQLQGLTDDEVRDLIAYLRSDRQVPVTADATSAALLFNGRDLSMWSADPAVWCVEDGELVGRTETGLAHNDFAVSHLSVADFELSFEVRLVGDRGNSGVQIRSEPVPGGEVRGYQCDIGTGWWGQIYEELGRGLLTAVDASSFVRRDDWNRYRIVAEGDHLRTWINDHPCADLRDPDGARGGIIALQVHSGGPTEVRFRDLRLTVR